MHLACPGPLVHDTNRFAAMEAGLGSWADVFKGVVQAGTQYIEKRQADKSARAARRAAESYLPAGYSYLPSPTPGSYRIPAIAGAGGGGLLLAGGAALALFLLLRRRR